MDIGKRLIALRKQCGYTQNGLAERAGVSQTHLRRVELGKADITVGHLQLLCDAMSISLRDFFDEASDADDTAVAFSSLSPKQKSFYLRFFKVSKTRIKAKDKKQALSNWITLAFLIFSAHEADNEQLLHSFALALHIKVGK